MRTKVINGIPVSMTFAEEMYEMLAEELFPLVKDIRRTPISVYAFLDVRSRGSRQSRTAYVDRCGEWKLSAVDWVSGCSRTETGSAGPTEPEMQRFVDRAARWFRADFDEVVSR